MFAMELNLCLPRLHFLNLFTKPPDHSPLMPTTTPKNPRNKILSKLNPIQLHIKIALPAHPPPLAPCAAGVPDIFVPQHT